CAVRDVDQLDGRTGDDLHDVDLATRRVVVQFVGPLAVEHRGKDLLEGRVIAVGPGLLGSHVQGGGALLERLHIEARITVGERVDLRLDLGSALARLRVRAVGRAVGHRVHAAPVARLPEPGVDPQAQHEQHHEHQQAVGATTAEPADEARSVEATAATTESTTAASATTADESVTTAPTAGIGRCRAHQRSDCCEHQHPPNGTHGDLLENYKHPLPE